MFAYLRKPHVDLATLILRLGLAAIFLAHGFVFLNQEQSWTDKISPTMQRVVSWGEFVCGLALAVGLLSRLAAVGVIVIMVGAIELVTGSQGFLPTSFTSEGYTFRAGAAYNFIIIVACLALIVLGSGHVSLDHLLFGRKKTATPAAAPSTTTAPVPPSAPYERAV
ncbi:MAG TPA: DoxX family protein [Gemmataceae bacterium]|jgi:putative oxidoreductase